MQIRIERTSEFIDWFKMLNLKDQLQIDSRIQRIRDHAHFGDSKNLGGGLAELRWKNGRRVYFVRSEFVVILLLNGGLKNAPKKDIQKARILLQKYAIGPIEE
jgi:putative addiction module killer protein